MREEYVLKSDGVGAGWLGAPELTYSAADAPSYVVTCVGDYSTIIMPGMRMKMTQGGAVKYFLVTKSAYSAPNTSLTLYGGTDYTLAATITAAYYSGSYAPAGFPINPLKWTVTLEDTTDAHQDNPTKDAYYNLGSLALSIPIGIWDVTLMVVGISGASSGNYTEIYAGASTSASSFTDNILRGRAYLGGVPSGIFMGNINRTKTLVLAAKTTYYLVAMTSLENQFIIGFNGASDAATTLRARSAYI